MMDLRGQVHLGYTGVLVVPTVPADRWGSIRDCHCVATEAAGGAASLRVMTIQFPL